jgi:pre-mRNA-splicing factor 18
MAKHEEEYLLKHAPQKLAELKKQENANKSSATVDDGSSAADSSSNVDKLPKLSRREVIRRLRERGEPITLFNESEADAFKRLRKLEILEPEVNRGLRNDLQAALEQVDQAYLEEILKTAKADSDPNEKKKLGDVHVQEDNLTFEDVYDMAKTAFRNKKDLEAHARTILTWVKFLLKCWGQHLNAREEHDKLSVKGKLASATYTQTVDYLRPLMRKLTTNTLTDDILEALMEIVQFMLDKEYIRANDAYLEMAIGNAPWPIGVTMVGIHARTGREKIFSRNVAHVMNDETQRKYIQGLKRLMTKCQIMFPTHPSKSVEYTPNSSINS